MATQGKILPPDSSKENTDDKRPKKSFVRVKKSAAKKPKVHEAEVLTDDERDENKDGEGDEKAVARMGDVIDESGEILEPEVFDDSDLELTLSDEKGLAPTSALQRYLNELRRYPLMNIEEERKEATKAYEQNDGVARGRLITANLRLVVKIAMEYRRAYSQMLDLIQEGNAGLVQAVNRFNPYRGVKLSTYAAWWIRAYILKFLMDNKSLVRMGTTEAQRKLFFRLRSEAEKMYALTQRFDTKLLAENIGVKESDVVEMHQRLNKNDMSLDAPVGEDSDSRHIDSLASGYEDAGDKLEREELLKHLKKHVDEVEKELNERDLYIFKNRILSDEPVTLQDVGEKFGITRERARQLESRIIKKVREKLEESGVVEA